MSDYISLILERIDEMKSEIVEFHKKLVQIPSENPPSKYKPVSNFTAEKFRELGLKTSQKRNNVIGELSNNSGPTLILYGHLDTVEAFKGWTKDPFGGEEIDGKIYGRGSSDDKSSVTATIYAIKALLEEGIELKGNIKLIAVVDEETGGFRGAEYLLSSNLVSGDTCLLGDASAGFPYAYCGGCMYITFVTYGKQAHGLGFPDLPEKYRSENSGVNAIERMVKIMSFLLELKEEIQEIESEYPSAEGWNATVSSINIAQIEGGNKITTVPDKCFLHCSVNTIPELDILSIRERILNFIEKMKEYDPYFDAVVQIPVAYDPTVIEENSKFAQAVKQAFKVVYGEERSFKTLLPSTDSHWFQERGIDTILIGASRSDNNIHTVDEFVYIEDLLNLTKLFAISALNYLT